MQILVIYCMNKYIKFHIIMCIFYFYYKYIKFNDIFTLYNSNNW